MLGYKIIVISKGRYRYKSVIKWATIVKYEALIVIKVWYNPDLLLSIGDGSHAGSRLRCVNGIVQLQTAPIIGQLVLVQSGSIP